MGSNPRLVHVRLVPDEPVVAMHIRHQPDPGSPCGSSWPTWYGSHQYLTHRVGCSVKLWQLEVEHM